MLESLQCATWWHVSNPLHHRRRVIIVDDERSSTIHRPRVRPVFDLAFLMSVSLTDLDTIHPGHFCRMFREGAGLSQQIDSYLAVRYILASGSATQ